MNKYHGDQKKKIDRAYVIWCCKSSRPLSLGETDKSFRKFMLAATSGRYHPPSRKTALEELTTCVAVSRQLVKAEIHELMEEEGLDLCISGMSLKVVVDISSCINRAVCVQVIYGVKTVLPC